MSATKSTMNREALLKIATLIRPALATQTFIPAYNHIAFDGHYAMTHNDITAILVKCEFPDPCCVPGELLIKSLGSFSGGEVFLKQGSNDHTLVVSSGRSNLKLPTLPIKSFPFDFPQPGSSGEALVLDAGIIEAIKLCLVSAGTNPNHPSAMGITLDMDNEGSAVLFSTDNYTISMASTKTPVHLPGDSPVIMPTFFCNQLIALTRAFPNLVNEMTMYLLPGALLVEFGDPNMEAALFTKTIDDLAPLDFHKIIKKHIDPDNVGKRMAEIPDAFDSAFSRQLLVLGAELEKVTKVHYFDGTMRLNSASQTGECDDSFGFCGDDRKNNKPHEFHIDPTFVVRGAKLCDQMFMGDRVLVMSNSKSGFLHIIAHVSAPARSE